MNELTSLWNSEVEKKWRELRDAAGHYISAWDPRMTMRIDEEERRNVRVKLMAWAVRWWEARGHKIECVQDDSDTDAFSIFEVPQPKGAFVTARLKGGINGEPRQGWVVSIDPLKIRGESGAIYECEGSPTAVINPPGRKVCRCEHPGPHSHPGSSGEAQKNPAPPKQDRAEH